MPDALVFGFPPAVLGYKALHPGMAVRVCAWHPHGVPEARRWAEPLPVSDGMCVECYQRFTAQRMGEQIPA